MKKYLIADPWCIIEEGFNPDNHRSSESIFSLGNGKMGQRANFEERYSGPSLQGSYIAGIYYPDKTRVGWWKNGYPEYFAKVLNSPNYIGIDVLIDGQQLNLFICKTSDFRRVLNMKEGTLSRSFTAELPDGKIVEVSTKRFLSMVDTETAAIRYSVKAVNFSGVVTFVPYIDGGVVNTDSNYDESFWNVIDMSVKAGEATLVGQTKKLDFRVAFSMRYNIIAADNNYKRPELIKKEAWVGNRCDVLCNMGETTTIEKFVGVSNTLNHLPDNIADASMREATKALNKGFNKMLAEHCNWWAQKWKHSDIVIDGDIEAQQGIRFNIFHLNQTYTGEDSRLNVGPKGFTGEKYGGTTYWDTEAYCIPFFLMTAPQEVTRQLLIYRYKHLERAIENAGKLGFTDGAALYPMVTINGEECHNEWEITFEEIHRNGAIAFAIYNYIRHTCDFKYLEEFGLEVLIGIARFWSQRITFSQERGKYVMLGVTGPNEYENNINNNWYTNRLACWCMSYTLEAIEIVKRNTPTAWKRIKEKVNYNEETEPTKWNNIVGNMHYPYNSSLDIFMQQDGYMDKEQRLTSDLKPEERPINQHWSWDRILRSCFIKQADTLQGVYLFEEEFDTATIERHFDFYEPRTVHESSLSPCVHSILAARIGRKEKAYEMYLRTSRLDIDDYNHEAHEGLHITSMAGTWMSIVEGFGGKRAYNGKLYLAPIIPDVWKEYSFHITFRGHNIEVKVDNNGTTICQQGSCSLLLNIYGQDAELNAGEVRTFVRK